MESWVGLEEFAKLAHLDKEKILEMVASGELKSKQENGEFLIDAKSGTQALVQSAGNAVMLANTTNVTVDSDFVEKTIGTILSLHEKVVSSKEETISSVKNENQFLKDALFNTQEVYEDDKKTIAILREQLRVAQEEIEFLKRKYRLMWGKAIDIKAKE
ncbi:DUF3972 domain-containing protein [Helicobacter winghamensis]|uniref:DUF3972 domain-containing protein n=1 Tax=Helicobacter winghamensis TaxID=157268 RepID=A0A2N3PJ71_9HELI|nr:DUF3972 domain-containing protein [Helicobacter winghamensis]EEO25436.1 hypothetical protein HWAG_00228 [Helicobacter winghamensis ATCC BAA-430]PKT78134.1 hypothetical protein BCM34_02700 [Helicobacter winghamensis]PKT78403.1 hypothetical protein BCM32_01470 [Helicobacter winghamensis]PKT78663.1 hypothetical protein BCM35_00990 [Helicobacter winghamensis]PKT80434.1 hypothetical protein BCM33_07890 [Helicobacter winghamensis]